MTPFTTFTAVAVPMDFPNIDTDQIIPARFLRKKRSEGYQNWLFHDLRLNGDGSENPAFVLNQPPYRAAQIIVGSVNFGCGSSREGAIWALGGYGIRALIAPSFGDIFYQNAPKNGLLPIVLTESQCSTLRRQLHEKPGAAVTVDLEKQTVTAPDGVAYPFEFDPFRKETLLKGQDDVGLTLGYIEQIKAFEQKAELETSWLVPRLG